MTDAEMEKIWNNLKRNLKSYCDENGFSDVMLGLSGGLDSAIVSVLSISSRLLIIRNAFWPACSAKRRKILCWRICRQEREEKP